MKNSEINISVALDEEKRPAKIHWSAADGKTKPGECKAFLLSIFEKETKETLRIDLWTNEMEIGEMDRFFFHTIKSMADTYHKATNNNLLASHMQQFAEHFGKETGIIPKEE